MIFAHILTSIKRFTLPTLNSHAMPASIVKVPTIESLHEVVAKTVEENKGKDIFLYYYASNDPATGKSWCPDCVRAGPIVEKKFSELDNAVLVDVPVGDRPTWKDLNHPYRHDEVIKISAVPTLVHWASKSKLVENDCEDITKLEQFVQRA